MSSMRIMSILEFPYFYTFFNIGDSFVSFYTI